MNEPITFSFSPTRSDYYKTLRAFILRQRTMIYVILVPCFLLIVSIYASITTHSFSTFTMILLAFLFFIVMSIFFYSPASVADKVSKDERLSCETTWVVDEEKISIKNKFSDSNFDWGTFGQVYETQEHYLLSYTTNKNMFQLVPKRAFASEADQEEFRKLLEAKTKPVKRIRSINLPELSRKTSMFIVYGIVAIFIIILVASSYIQASR